MQTVLLSADGENDPDILSIIGASASLMVSDIPWAGPLGAVRVGRVNGKFIANPTHSEMKDSDLDLVYVGNEKDIVMYEGAAKEISEADFNAALKWAQEIIQPQITAQKELASKGGKKKREITVKIVPDEILSEAKALAGDRFVPALLTPGKLNREGACNAIKEEVGAKLVEKFGAEKVTPFVINDAFYYIQKEAVRKLILESGKRLDGRKFDQIRPISGEVGILPRAHGSAIFARGETQAVTLATLGTGEDAQEFDSYTGGENEKKFILHYNFPNFSVGETGRTGSPGRREIGHGRLAKRALVAVLPTKEDFPYSIRVVSEITESNGEIILFVDEMHTVVGAGAAEGAMDAGNMLKPMLARGELRMIGATTLDEDLLDRRREADRAAELLDQPDERLHDRARAAAGEVHAPLALEVADQRVDRGCMLRVATHEQRVEREHLPQLLVLDVLAHVAEDRPVALQLHEVRRDAQAVEDLLHARGVDAVAGDTVELLLDGDEAGRARLLLYAPSVAATVVGAGVLRQPVSVAWYSVSPAGDVSVCSA